MNTNPQRHISTKYIDYGDSSYFGRLAPDGCESRHGPMDRKWERSYSGLSTRSRPRAPPALFYIFHSFSPHQGAFRFPLLLFPQI